METVFRDYRDKGVQFYYVYKTVQHPEINNYVSVFTLEERLKHIQEAKRLMQTEMPWICDSMDNQVKKKLGSAPNGEFLVDPDGKILRKRFWSNPKTLREDLEKFVGPVDHVTTVEDLPTKMKVEPRSIASGVLPRIKLPGGLVPLKLEPVFGGEHPFFAKIRAEATLYVVSQGKGKMYIGVYLDPLYKVHWNNKAGSVSATIKSPEGVVLSESELVPPKVDVEADIDPRQFLLDVKKWPDDEEPLEVELRYTVCDDADTFCVMVKQQYRIFRERNGGLGSRPGIFMPKMFANVRELDKNGDGNLTKDELPPGEVTLYVGHIDYDGNEIIEKEEIDTFLRMFNNGRGFDSPHNDGGN